MLSSIIKLKLEKNCCSCEKLENFFAKKVFYIDDRKRFKEPSVKLVIKHPYDSTLILTLPRKAIPNSFALELFSSLYKKNELALPIILKYLVQRNLSKDFDEISKKLQAKMDQDIQEAQLQHNSEISKEIELCKKDILNVLDGGKSVLSVQLKQKYYSILENDVKELEAEISEELEDYVNNTNIHKMYQSLNSKIKKIDKIKQNCHNCHENMVEISLYISGTAALLMSCLAPSITLMCGISGVRDGGLVFSLETLMYTATPFLVVATLALTVAGIAYLTSCVLEHSFAKEMQDFIEGPKYVDKATNTEDVKKLEQEETEVGDLKVEPSAPPYDEPKQPGLYPDLSEELSALLFNKKDSQPSSNFNSALPPSNTARDVIQS